MSFGEMCPQNSPKSRREFGNFKPKYENRTKSHNEYQSNIVMNRSPLMAVKGRQANSEILTTRRVSSPVHLYQFCTVKFFEHIR